MNEMIERVARAAQSAHAEANLAFATMTETRAGWEAVARAAIEAMREPTEGMLDILGEMPTRHFYPDGSEAGWDEARKLDRIFATPQNKWSDEDAAFIAATQQRTQLQGCSAERSSAAETVTLAGQPFASTTTGLSTIRSPSQRPEAGWS